jgi:hypothetical protein
MRDSKFDIGDVIEWEGDGLLTQGRVTSWATEGFPVLVNGFLRLELADGYIRTVLASRCRLVRKAEHDYLP